jgi:hypothetical protein
MLQNIVCRVKKVRVAATKILSRSSLGPPPPLSDYANKDKSNEDGKQQADSKKRTGREKSGEN